MAQHGARAAIPAVRAVAQRVAACGVDARGKPMTDEELDEREHCWPEDEGENVRLLVAEIRRQNAEITLDDARIAALEAVIREIPECKVHGDLCLPHAKEWIEKAKVAIAGPPRGKCGFEFHHADCDCQGVGGSR